MFFHSGLALALVPALMATGTAADGGDDFSNNLFSDLAPLLSLLGERFTTQFMSASMGWWDHIVFALAPLGIITAISAAIRVAGPPWLRAVIGRARENRATVELELMSSTSHEVCELWNGQGIIRTTGAAEIQEIIYLEDHRDDPETFGLYTLEAAMASNLIKERETGTPHWLALWQRAMNWMPDEEQLATENRTPPEKSAPNISLNLNTGSRKNELIMVAFCGIVLQLGVLVFSAYSVYHPTFNTRFLKNGEPVQRYAYPVFAIGTSYLTLGMILCSALVEQSTEEKEFVAALKTDENLKAHILWLQRSHVVSDQTFSATVIFRGVNRPDKNTLNRIMTSRRAPANKGVFYWMYRILHAAVRALWRLMKPEHRKVMVIMKDRADRVLVVVPFLNRLLTKLKTVILHMTYSDWITIPSIWCALSGFILQFIGLRGLNWSTSIAQLVCIGVMTMLRAWVRRHLIAPPIPKQVLPQHEMDWLALWIARKLADSKNGKFNWPKHTEDEDELEKFENLDDRLILNIVTKPEKIAVQQDGPTVQDSMVNEVRDSGTNDDTHQPEDAGVVEGEPEGDQHVHPEQQGARAKQNQGTLAQDALRIRKRLAQLTRWRGRATEPSIALAKTISITLNALIKEAQFLDSGEDSQEPSLDPQEDSPDPAKDSFTWTIEVQVKRGREERNEVLKFSAHKQRGGGWHADATEIEAALSMWLFQIQEMKDIAIERRELQGETLKGYGGINDWLQMDVESNQQLEVLRFLGPGDHNLKRDIGWWIGGHIEIEVELTQMTDAAIHGSGFPGFAGSIGFTGTMGPGKIASFDISQPLLMVRSMGSLEKILVQHLFTAFMWALVGDRRVSLDSEGTSIVSSNGFSVRNPDTLKSIRLHNKVLEGMVQKIEATGLCNAGDAYLCIIPPLSYAKLLPEQEIVRFVWDEGRKIELLRQWRDVAPTYIQVFQISRTYGERHPFFLAASAIMIEVLCSIVDAIRLDKQQYTDIRRDKQQYTNIRLEKQRYTKMPERLADLSTLRDELQEELRSLPHAVAVDFATLLKYQRRLDPQFWDALGGIDPSTSENRSPSNLIRSGLLPRLMYASYTKLCSTNLNLIYCSKLVGKDRDVIWASDVLGWSLIHYAAVVFHDSMTPNVTELLTKGADPNQVDLGGRSPLHNGLERGIYVESGSMKLLQLLSEGGAGLEISARNGRVPLHLTSLHGHVPATRALLQRGANIEAQDSRRQRPIHLAVYSGNPKVVHILLQRGANVGARDFYERSALHHAAIAGDVEIVMHLLARVDIDICGEDRVGNTPLHLSAIFGHAIIAREILKTVIRRARSNFSDAPTRTLAELLEAKNDNGDTVLHLVVENGHAEVVRAIIGAVLGTETHTKTPTLAELLETTNMSGYTVLHLAAEIGHAEIAAELIRHSSKADLGARTPEGFQPLYLAAMKGHVKIVELLLSKNADPNSSLPNPAKVSSSLAVYFDRVKSEMHICPSAVAMAASYGYTDVVRILVDAGAEVHATPSFHMTIADSRFCNEIKVSIYAGALSAAVGGGHHETVQYLLQRDDRSIERSGGVLTLSDVVVEGNVQLHTDFSRVKLDSLQLSGKAKINLYRGSISIGAGLGHLEIVRSLIKAGVTLQASRTDLTTVRRCHVRDEARLSADYNKLKFLPSGYSQALHVAGSGRVDAYHGPLVGAILRRNVAMVQLLLEAEEEESYPDTVEMRLEGNCVLEDDAIFSIDCADLRISSLVRTKERGKLHAHRGALAAAAAKGNVEIVKLLLQSRFTDTGMEPSAVVSHPRSSVVISKNAMEAAKENKHDEIVALISGWRGKEKSDKKVTEGLGKVEEENVEREMAEEERIEEETIEEDGKK